MPYLMGRDDDDALHRACDDIRLRTVEQIVNNATDFTLINAAAHAWIEAGGDADGFEWLWHHVRNRIGELA